MSQSGDSRSRIVVFAAHCLLNQNVKVQGLVDEHPAAVMPLLRLLFDRGAGIVQMPCPELRELGLGRPLGTDTREQYDTPSYRQTCARIAAELAAQISAFLAAGYRVPCVLGVEGSPSCSVVRAPVLGPEKQRVLRPGSGLFIEALDAELARAQLDVPLIGVPETREAGSLEEALGQIASLLEPRRRAPVGDKQRVPAGPGPAAEDVVTAPLGPEPEPDTHPGMAEAARPPPSEQSAARSRLGPELELREPRAHRVRVEAGQVISERPDHSTERVRMSDLQRVEIQTFRSMGIQPLWVLTGLGDAKVVLPMGLDGETELLVKLQQLPGFDDEALVEAVSSTADETFVCWQRP
ncbi:MAG: hypothetical protein JXR96_19840 [Deltaproteobacteria bacterium]|nr:hypothetical protein [Deltaproteobacteria bacterium]